MGGGPGRVPRTPVPAEEPFLAGFDEIQGVGYGIVGQPGIAGAMKGLSATSDIDTAERKHMRNVLFKMRQLKDDPGDVGLRREIERMTDWRGGLTREERALGWRTLSGGQSREFRSALEGVLRGDDSGVRELMRKYRRPVPVQHRELWKAGEEVDAWAKRQFGASSKAAEESFGYQFWMGIGSFGTALGTAVIPGVGPLLGGAFTAAQGMGEAADRAVEHYRNLAKSDPATAWNFEQGSFDHEITRAALLGGGVGVTEMAPIELFLKRMPVPGLKVIGEAVKRSGGERVIRALGRVGLGAAIEAFQEGGAQALQNLIAQQIYKPTQSIAEGIGGATALGGAVGGAIFGTKEIWNGTFRRSRKGSEGVRGDAARQTEEASAGQLAFEKEAKVLAEEEYGENGRVWDGLGGGGVAPEKFRRVLDRDGNLQAWDLAFPTGDGGFEVRRLSREDFNALGPGEQDVVRNHLDALVSLWRSIESKTKAAEADEASPLDTEELKAGRAEAADAEAVVHANRRLRKSGIPTLLKSVWDLEVDGKWVRVGVSDVRWHNKRRRRELESGGGSIFLVGPDGGDYTMSFAELRARLAAGTIRQAEVPTAKDAKKARDAAQKDVDKAAKESRDAQEKLRKADEKLRQAKDRVAQSQAKARPRYEVFARKKGRGWGSAKDARRYRSANRKRFKGWEVAPSGRGDGRWVLRRQLPVPKQPAPAKPVAPGDAPQALPAEVSEEEGRIADAETEANPGLWDKVSGGNAPVLFGRGERGGETVRIMVDRSGRRWIMDQATWDTLSDDEKAAYKNHQAKLRQARTAKGGTVDEGPDEPTGPDEEGPDADQELDEIDRKLADAAEAVAQAETALANAKAAGNKGREVRAKAALKKAQDALATLNEDRQAVETERGRIEEERKRREEEARLAREAEAAEAERRRTADEAAAKKAAEEEAKRKADLPAGDVQQTAPVDEPEGGTGTEGEGEGETPPAPAPAPATTAAPAADLPPGDVQQTAPVDGTEGGGTATPTEPTEPTDDTDDVGARIRAMTPQQRYDAEVRNEMRNDTRDVESVRIWRGQLEFEYGDGFGSKLSYDNLAALSPDVRREYVEWLRQKVRGRPRGEHAEAWLDQVDLDAPSDRDDGTGAEPAPVQDLPSGDVAQTDDVEADDAEADAALARIARVFGVSPEDIEPMADGRMRVGIAAYDIEFDGRGWPLVRLYPQDIENFRNAPTFLGLSMADVEMRDDGSALLPIDPSEIEWSGDRMTIPIDPSDIEPMQAPAGEPTLPTGPSEIEPMAADRVWTPTLADDGTPFPTQQAAKDHAKAQGMGKAAAVRMKDGGWAILPVVPKERRAQPVDGTTPRITLAGNVYKKERGAELGAQQAGLAEGAYLVVPVGRGWGWVPVTDETRRAAASRPGVPPKEPASAKAVPGDEEPTEQKTVRQPEGRPGVPPKEPAAAKPVPGDEEPTAQATVTQPEGYPGAEPKGEASEEEIAAAELDLARLDADAMKDAVQRRLRVENVNAGVAERVAQATADIMDRLATEAQDAQALGAYVFAETRERVYIERRIETLLNVAGVDKAIARRAAERLAAREKEAATEADRSDAVEARVADALRNAAIDEDVAAKVAAEYAHTASAIRDLVARRLNAALFSRKVSLAAAEEAVARSGPDAPKGTERAAEPSKIRQDVEAERRRREKEAERKAAEAEAPQAPAEPEPDHNPFVADALETHIAEEARREGGVPAEEARRLAEIAAKAAHGAHMKHAAQDERAGARTTTHGMVVNAMRLSLVEREPAVRAANLAMGLAAGVRRAVAAETDPGKKAAAEDRATARAVQRVADALEADGVDPSIAIRAAHNSFSEAYAGTRGKDPGTRSHELDVSVFEAVEDAMLYYGGDLTDPDTDERQLARTVAQAAVEAYRDSAQARDWERGREEARAQERKPKARDLEPRSGRTDVLSAEEERARWGDDPGEGEPAPTPPPAPPPAPDAEATQTTETQPTGTKPKEKPKEKPKSKAKAKPKQQKPKADKTDGKAKAAHAEIRKVRNSFRKRLGASGMAAQPADDAASTTEFEMRRVVDVALSGQDSDTEGMIADMKGSIAADLRAKGMEEGQAGRAADEAEKQVRRILGIEAPGKKGKKPDEPSGAPATPPGKGPDDQDGAAEHPIDEATGLPVIPRQHTRESVGGMSPSELADQATRLEKALERNRAELQDLEAADPDDPHTAWARRNTQRMEDDLAELRKEWNRRVHGWADSGTSAKALLENVHPVHLSGLMDKDIEDAALSPDRKWLTVNFTDGTSAQIATEFAGSLPKGLRDDVKMRLKAAEAKGKAKAKAAPEDTREPVSAEWDEAGESIAVTYGDGTTETVTPDEMVSMAPDLQTAILALSGPTPKPYVHPLEKAMAATQAMMDGTPPVRATLQDDGAVYHLEFENGYTMPMLASDYRMLPENVRRAIDAMVGEAARKTAGKKGDATDEPSDEPRRPPGRGPDIRGSIEAEADRLAARLSAQGASDEEAGDMAETVQAHLEDIAEAVAKGRDHTTPDQIAAIIRDGAPWLPKEESRRLQDRFRAIAHRLAGTDPTGKEAKRLEARERRDALWDDLTGSGEPVSVRRGKGSSVVLATADGETLEVPFAELSGPQQKMARAAIRRAAEAEADDRADDEDGAERATLPGSLDPTAPTPQELDALDADIAEAAAGMFGPDFRTRVVEGSHPRLADEAGATVRSGFYLPRLNTAWIAGTVYDPGSPLPEAVSREDMVSAMMHEGLHFLRGAGAFTRSDGKDTRAWKTLVDEAHASWRKKYGIDKLYGDGREAFLDNGGTQAEWDAMLAEEAIAERLADYEQGRKDGLSGPQRHLFDKILRFLKRLGAAMRGRTFKGADAIVRDIAEGRYREAASMNRMVDAYAQGREKRRHQQRQAVAAAGDAAAPYPDSVDIGHATVDFRKDGARAVDILVTDKETGDTLRAGRIVKGETSRLSTDPEAVWRELIDERNKSVKTAYARHMHRMAVIRAQHAKHEELYGSWDAPPPLRIQAQMVEDLSANAINPTHMAWLQHRQDFMADKREIGWEEDRRRDAGMPDRDEDSYSAGYGRVTGETDPDADPVDDIPPEGSPYNPWDRHVASELGDQMDVARAAATGQLVDVDTLAWEDATGSQKRASTASRAKHEYDPAKFGDTRHLESAKALREAWDRELWRRYGDDFTQYPLWARPTRSDNVHLEEPHEQRMPEIPGKTNPEDFTIDTWRGNYLVGRVGWPVVTQKDVDATIADRKLQGDWKVEAPEGFWMPAEALGTADGPQHVDVPTVSDPSLEMVKSMVADGISVGNRPAERTEAMVAAELSQAMDALNAIVLDRKGHSETKDERRRAALAITKPIVDLMIADPKRPTAAQRRALADATRKLAELKIDPVRREAATGALEIVNGLREELGRAPLDLDSVIDLAERTGVSPRTLFAGYGATLDGLEKARTSLRWLEQSTAAGPASNRRHLEQAVAEAAGRRNRAAKALEAAEGRPGTPEAEIEQARRGQGEAERLLARDIELSRNELEEAEERLKAARLALETHDSDAAAAKAEWAAVRRDVEAVMAEGLSEKDIMERLRGLPSNLLETPTGKAKERRRNAAKVAAAREQPGKVARLEKQAREMTEEERSKANMESRLKTERGYVKTSAAEAKRIQDASTPEEWEAIVREAGRIGDPGKAMADIGKEGDRALHADPEYVERSRQRAVLQIAALKTRIAEGEADVAAMRDKAARTVRPKEEPPPAPRGRNPEPEDPAAKAVADAIRALETQIAKMHGDLGRAAEIMEDAMVWRSPYDRPSQARIDLVEGRIRQAIADLRRLEESYAKKAGRAWNRDPAAQRAMDERDAPPSEPLPAEWADVQQSFAYVLSNDPDLMDTFENMAPAIAEAMNHKFPRHATRGRRIAYAIATLVNNNAKLKAAFRRSEETALAGVPGDQLQGTDTPGHYIARQMKRLLEYAVKANYEVDPQPKREGPPKTANMPAIMGEALDSRETRIREGRMYGKLPDGWEVTRDGLPYRYETGAQRRIEQKYGDRGHLYATVAVPGGFAIAPRASLAFPGHGKLAEEEAAKTRKGGKAKDAQAAADAREGKARVIGLSRRSSRKEMDDFDKAFSRFARHNVPGIAEAVVRDKEMMDGMWEGVKDQIFGAERNIPKNVRVRQKQRSKDILPLVYDILPNTAWARKSHLLRNLVRNTMRREGTMSWQAQEANRKWDAIVKPLSNQELSHVYDLLWEGDAQNAEWTARELEEAGFDRKIADGYVAARKWWNEWTRKIDAHNREMVVDRRKLRNKRIREMHELTAARSGKSREQVRKLWNRRAALRRRFRDGKAKNPDTAMDEIDALTREMLGFVPDDAQDQRAVFEALAEADQMQTLIDDTSIDKKTGYMPHQFRGRWKVYRETSELDGNGDPVWELVAGERGFFADRTAAIRVARTMATRPGNENVNFAVEPVAYHTGTDPTAKPTYLTDESFDRMMAQMSRATGLRGAELRDAMKPIAKKSFKRRIPSFAKQREDVVGWDKDVTRVARHFTGQAVQYIHLDKFKFEALTAMEREGLSPAIPASQQDRPYLAKQLQDYIRDVNGEPQWLERKFDELLESSWATPLRTAIAAGGLGFAIGAGQGALTGLVGGSLLVGGPIAALPVGLAMGAYMGARVGYTAYKSTDMKTRAITGQMISDMTHAKLGAFFNLGSALVNMSQAVNTVAVLGTRDTIAGMKRFAMAVAWNLTGKGSQQARRDWERMMRADVNPTQGFAEGTRNIFKEQLKIEKWSMAPFAAMEMFNRGAALLGAYNQDERRNPQNTAANRHEAAQRVMDRTQLTFGAANKPRLLRNTFIRVPGQFKNFLVQQTDFVFGMNKKEFARFGIAMFLMAGATGMPFQELFDDILEQLLGWRPSEALGRYLIEAGAAGEIGMPVSNLMLAGIPGLAGWNLSERTGMGRWFPKETRDFYGPWGSTMVAMHRLGQTNAEFSDFLRSAIPGLGNPYQALVRAVTGDYAKRNPWKHQAPDMTLTRGQNIGAGLGLEPLEAFKTRRYGQSAQRATRIYGKTRENYLAAIAEHTRKGFREKARRLWDEAAENGITIDQASVDKAVKKQRTLRATRRADALPKDLRGEFEPTFRRLAGEEPRTRRSTHRWREGSAPRY